MARSKSDKSSKQKNNQAVLQERLADREAATRKAAAREAGERLVAGVAPRLLELACDRNSGVAATAVWALGRLRFAPAEEQLASSLHAPHAALRKGAAWALGRLGTSNALAALLDALPDADETTTRSILLALDEMPSDTIAPRLVALLRDPRGQARARAARALLRHPAQAIPAVVASLHEAATDVETDLLFRRAAAHVLAGAAAPSALDALLDLSRRDDPRTRLYATRGLAALAPGAEAGRARLHDLCADERRDVAAAARAALGEAPDVGDLQADGREPPIAGSGSSQPLEPGAADDRTIEQPDAAPGSAGILPAPAHDGGPAGSRRSQGHDGGPAGSRRSQAGPGRTLPLDLPPGQSYLLTVLPGLEDVAADEIAALPGARVTSRYTGALEVRLDAPPAVLCGLRTVLDALLYAGRLSPSETVESPRRDRRSMRAALAALTAARPDQPLTFYVAVPRGTPAATAAALRDSARAELERAGARVSGTDAALTAEVVMAGETPLLGIRVLRDPPGHRPLPAGALPASLNASLAAALVRLAAPTPEDVFLDPLCGAGTLLRERGLAGPYARLLGGDADERALALARRNLREQRNVTLARWDATRLPLDAASVDRAALNPPYGRRTGSHAANRDLYPALLAELGRVIRPGGLIALVTAERRLTTAALRAQTALARDRELAVRAGGLDLTVFVLRRR